LHDREITYSLAVPPSHALARSAQSLYQAMHGSLAECLRRLGFDASLVALQARRADASPLAEPFMCFARRAAGDVIVGKHKVGGSAQRRWRGAVLQHGSVLLAASPAAPEFLGLNDLAVTAGTADSVIAIWREFLPAALQANLSSGELAAEQCRHAAEIAAEKYQRPAWNQRR
jgi:lipoate-protein ligase A